MTTWTEESASTSTWDSIGRYKENLIPYSADFSKWSKTATVSGNVVSDVSTVQSQQVYLETVNFIDDSAEVKPRCFSAIVKKDAIHASTRFGALRVSYVNSANICELKFDTSTGDIAVYRYLGVIVDYGVIDDGENWIFWFSCNSNDTISRISIFPAYSKGALTNTFDVTVLGSMTVLGAQLENGESPSEYMPTNGYSVTWEAA